MWLAYGNPSNRARLSGGFVEVSHQRHELCGSQLLVSLDLVQDLGFDPISIASTSSILLVADCNSATGIPGMLYIVIIRIINGIELINADIICKVLISICPRCQLRKVPSHPRLEVLADR